MTFSSTTHSGSASRLAVNAEGEDERTFAETPGIPRRATTARIGAFSLLAQSARLNPPNVLVSGADLLLASPYVVIARHPDDLEGCKLDTE
jgi:hypothetical protein